MGSIPVAGARKPTRLCRLLCFGIGNRKGGSEAEENSPVDCFRRRGRDRRVSAGAIPVAGATKADTDVSAFVLIGKSINFRKLSEMFLRRYKAYRRFVCHRVNNAEIKSA